MSVSYIPEKVKIRLWGKAAGRCQYAGCNKPLWKDAVTKAEFNISYLAHIIADKPDGPRGDTELSEKLKADINNLMLMCDEHHRLIDKEDVYGHPVGLLHEMKQKHESRIEIQSSIQEDRQSHILLYGANIGEHFSPVSMQKAAQAMVPNRYPAESKAIELGMKNSSFEDVESDYWEIEKVHLRRQFNERVKSRLANGEIEHFSIFALAPQPLLIELGRLLSDIPAADVFQLHREPPDWKWQENPDGFEYLIKEPDEIHPVVALNLSLSATIENSRISSVFTDKHSIWTITIDQPNNDFMKSREQLSQFRRLFRILLDKLKAMHGEKTTIHLFPAIPVSIAVEIGRVWMPKADATLIVYDQNQKTNGFLPRLEISNIEGGNVS